MRRKIIFHRYLKEDGTNAKLSDIIGRNRYNRVTTDVTT